MLSARQRKEADRVGGIELVLPYPSGMTPPALDLDEECDARPAEITAAHRMIGSIADDGLIPVRITVARLRQQGTDPEVARRIRHYLTVLIIGRRWVHASTRRRPRVMWSAAALEDDG